MARWPQNRLFLAPHVLIHTRFEPSLHTMVKAVLRLFLICTITIGLSLPKLGVVLPGVQTVVICNGSERVTITINSNGAPVELAEDSVAPCTNSDPLDPLSAHNPAWVKVAYIDAYHLPDTGAPTPVSAHFTLKPPSQGPSVPA